MPRSTSPYRYADTFFRLAAILEAREDPFTLAFESQRDALDARQTLYSFSHACHCEAGRARKRTDLPAYSRWHNLHKALLRWELIVDPPYKKDKSLLDHPAKLKLIPKDLLPRNRAIAMQLDALEQPTTPALGPSSTSMDSLFRDLGIEPDKDK